MAEFFVVLLFAVLAGGSGYAVGYNRGAKGKSANPFSKE